MTRYARRRFAVFVVGVALLAAATFFVGCGSPTTLPTSSKQATDFTLTDLADNKPFHLADVVGKKGVLLEFFATWCPECMAAVPKMKEFQSKYGDEVALVTVSIDEQADVVRRWMKKDEITYTVVHDPNTVAAAAYTEVPGRVFLPLVVGIDRSGRIVYRDHAFPADPAALAAKLDLAPAGAPKLAPAPAAEGKAAAEAAGNRP